MSEEQGWWPKWFPYPSAWLRFLIAASALGSSIGFWESQLETSYCVAYGRYINCSAPFLLVVATTLSIVAVIRHIWSSLFDPDDPSCLTPWWMPTRKSWCEGGKAAIIAILVPVSVLIVFLALLGLGHYVWSGFAVLATPSIGGGISATLWIVTSLYFYHADKLIRDWKIERSRQNQNKQKRGRKKGKNKRDSLDIDPIEAELNQLRGQLGHTKVKNPRKKP